MAMHELKRTHYEDVGDATIRHDTRDHRQDMTHYHVPVMQMHQEALHGWGIALGLQVTQTGPSAVTIAEGVALDVQGRMLPLAAQGQAPGQPGKAFVHTTGQLVEVPVVVGTEGLADGAYYVTIELATTFISPGEPVEGRWLPQEQRIVSTPLLRLQPTAGFMPDGTAVILATVTVAGGMVTQLSGAERQLVPITAGAVVVRQGDAGRASAPVGDHESGRMGPLATGGLAIEVPAAGDQVVVQRVGDHNFQALTVRADQLRVAGDLAVSGTVNGRDVAADAAAFAAHGAGTENPHHVTAGQIDTAGGPNRLVEQINAGGGVINEARLDPTLARAAEVSAKVAKAGDTMTGALALTAAETGLSVTHNATVGGTLTVGSNVGIGTTSPATKLEVVGDWTGEEGALRLTGDKPTIRLSGGAISGNQSWILHVGGNGPGNLEFHRRTGPESWSPVMVLAPTHNVGIGTPSPNTKLDVAGNLQILTGSNPIRFTAGWTSFPEAATNQAEISNDTSFFRTLMIAGNKSAGLGRRVSVWDRLEVNGTFITTGKVGIGTANPAFQLSLGSSTARTKLALYETDASNAYGLGIGGGVFRLHVSHSGARFAFFDSAAEDAREIVTIGGTGNLVVTGTARKPGGGSWAALSDRQLKTNIQQLKGALDTLLRLRGVCFEWLEPAKQGNLTGPQIGMIAQEVETVLPDWVSTTPEGYKLLAIRGFEALTVEAFRELQIEHTALQAQHGALEARVKQLEAQVRAKRPMDIYHRNGAV